MTDQDDTVCMQPIADQSPWAEAHRMERASRIEGKRPAPLGAPGFQQAADAAYRETIGEASTRRRRDTHTEALIADAHAPPTEIELDAQLSDAALQTTPAVKQYGCAHAMEGSCPKCTPVQRVPLLPPRESGGPACNHTMWTMGCRDCADWSVCHGVEFARHMATRPPGDVGWATPPLPPDAIVLTGPDAALYRAVQTASAAALVAQQAHAQAGQALRDAIQAMCAAMAPGKEA